MKISRTEIFKKDYRELAQDVQKACNKQIVQLLMDYKHPSLNLERIQGFKDLYSVRVNIQYRMSLMIIAHEEIILRRVLNHDDLYKSPWIPLSPPF